MPAGATHRPGRSSRPPVVVEIEPDGVEGRPGIHELGRQDPTGAHRSVGPDLALEGQSVGVALWICREKSSCHWKTRSMRSMTRPGLPCGISSRSGFRTTALQRSRSITPATATVSTQTGVSTVRGAPAELVPLEADHLVRVHRHIDPRGRVLVPAKPAKGDLGPVPHPGGVRLLPEGEEEGLLLVRDRFARRGCPRRSAPGEHLDRTSSATPPSGSSAPASGVDAEKSEKRRTSSQPHESP
jgi:hypothetical protein